MHRARALRLTLAAALMAVVAAAPVAAATPQPFFQGFESDSTGWSNVTRVPSGTSGITSRTGSWHAETDQSPPPATASSFTQWGGYTDEFPDGGYSTSAWVYLDVSTEAASDTRFDWSSAVNTPAGTHRRDFVFNGGYYDDTDLTGSGPRFVFSASNNATRSGAFPKNPGRDPVAITTSGWYEFRHVFRDNGGVLAVDLEIRSDSGSGSLVHSWTLSDPTDLIGTTVGGNRYGWFVIQEFTVLAVDDTRLDVRVGPPTDQDACKDGGWQTFNYPREFKNQGDCIQFVNTGK